MRVSSLLNSPARIRMGPQLKRFEDLLTLLARLFVQSVLALQSLRAHTRLSRSVEQTVFLPRISDEALDVSCCPYTLL